MVTPDRAVLDNPVWHALGASPSTVCGPENGPLAQRYASDLAPFAALPDNPDGEAWDALRTLVGPGAGAVLFRREIAVAGGWDRVGSIPCDRMVASTTPRVTREGGRSEEVIELGTEDVDDMLTLTTLVAPGPFERRTIELGTYLGIRVDGRLGAMGGERMRPPGWSELSAICTHPDLRRRGLAAAIMFDLMRMIEQRVDRTFLHVAAHNIGGIRAYDRLGFKVRCEPEVAILVAPE